MESSSAVWETPTGNSAISRMTINPVDLYCFIFYTSLLDANGAHLNLGDFRGMLRRR